ncbi:unnamed protein product [Phytophthora fragariaefolia]|uniref:Unnamed protein product n=1 Tax=Phytophthora fragariaefolia TaxID=1490495 RepID=A0A9W7CUR6_9STRA|nr:unnamed protein product [Phytophthora fragariaefolia]
MEEVKIRITPDSAAEVSIVTTAFPKGLSDNGTCLTQLNIPGAGAVMVIGNMLISVSGQVKQDLRFNM